MGFGDVNAQEARATRGAHAIRTKQSPIRVHSRSFAADPPGSLRQGRVAEGAEAEEEEQEGDGRDGDFQPDRADAEEGHRGVEEAVEGRAVLPGAVAAEGPPAGPAVADRRLAPVVRAAAADVEHRTRHAVRLRLSL